MSFNLPGLRNKGSLSENADIPCGPYGIPDPLIHGIGRKHAEFSHPLEATETNVEKSRLQREMTILRNIQGLHAPLRLAMELKSTESIGRLPFLPSSSLMRDVILGRDEEIGVEDVFNTAEFREQMVQPHAVVEKKLGLL